MSRDAKIVAALLAASVLGTGVLVLRYVEKVRAQGGLAAMLAPPERGAEFRYAAVRRTQADPPGRFAAPLPQVEEFGDLDAERFPPRAYVRDLLCSGDDGMWRRLREAISASRDASEADVARSYGELLRHCPGDGCFATRYLGEAQPAAIALPAWRVLASCPGREADELFRRPGAPAVAVLSRADRAEWSSGRIAPPEPDRLADAALRVIARSEDHERRLAAFHLAKAGRKGAEALLALHAKEQDPERRHDLAMALSRVDDPRARAALRAACARRPDPACEQGAAPRGDEAPEPPGAPPPAPLVARLRALGLLPEGDLPAADVAGVASADQLLVAARRAHAFDVETGEFPNGHDSLLRDLAALAPGALGGALFDEVPPPEDDEQRPYVLRAWAFGERWEVDAKNLGDWFDVDACVGLLNVLARERKLDVRWLVLETGDQAAIVAAGPEAGLRAAVAEGLLRGAGASDAADVGKAFEQEVLEQLRGGKR